MNFRPRFNVPTGTGFLCIAITLFFSTVTAAADTVPENAYATGSTYGKEWQCSRGYSERNGGCRKVNVPEHGYLNAFGDRWECERGYRKANERCVAIVVPENAFLSEQGYGGKGWECERGFLARGSSCVEIKVPEHAYLSSGGRSTGWVCDRGYRQVGNVCEKIAIPKNAHLGYDGNNWECDKPFERRGATCVIR